MSTSVDDDRDRHAESVRRWLAEHRYSPRSLGSAAADVKNLARSAGLAWEDEEMPEHKAAPLSVSWLAVGETPPAYHRPPSRYDALVAQLRTEPGRWAKLGTGGKGAVSSLRRRGAEVSARANGAPGRMTIYARYVGPE